MSETESSPRIGQFVRVQQGRDAGHVYVIIRILDERFVLIADGDKRKYDRPKKKNINHLEMIDDVSPEVQNSVEETGRVTNGKLRFVISRFIDKQVTELQKGEQLDG